MIDTNYDWIECRILWETGSICAEYSTGQTDLGAVSVQFQSSFSAIPEQF